MDSLLPDLDTVHDPNTRVLVTDTRRREGESLAEWSLRIGRVLFSPTKHPKTTALDAATMEPAAERETVLRRRRKPRPTLLERKRPTGPAKWDTGFTFYLGTHHPDWLEKTDVPLFVSYNTLRARKKLPKARGRWALDSGGFTELQQKGRWTISPREYVAAVARFQREIGGLVWAAPQDWMCEPAVIEGGVFKKMEFVGTGLSVPVHQQRTVDNFLELTALWGEYSDDDCPFRPALQGYAPDDYLACWDLYEAHGIRLEDYPLVPVGTLCRRENTAEIELIMSGLRERAQLDFHGLGVKTGGLQRCAHLFGENGSSDSLAWSINARFEEALDVCDAHKSCSNCLEYALLWREKVLDVIRHRPRQYALNDR